MAAYVQRAWGGRLSAIAFPEDYKVPSGFEDNHVEIVDGLWYYDDGLTGGNPKHKKEIEAMIQNGKKRQADIQTNN